MRENELQTISTRSKKKIMLPKDYLAYKLSGTFGGLFDASGMLLLDVKINTGKTDDGNLWSGEEQLRNC